jgi:hypothetical protein
MPNGGAAGCLHTLALDRMQRESREIIMKRIHCIRRFARVLAGLAGTLLAFVTVAPALATMPPPDPGEPAAPPVVHTVVTGGMPGWQIALIAAGAALIAAVLAVLADRVWVARRQVAAPTA